LRKEKRKREKERKRERVMAKKKEGEKEVGKKNQGGNDSLFDVFFDPIDSSWIAALRIVLGLSTMFFQNGFKDS